MGLFSNSSHNPYTKETAMQAGKIDGEQQSQGKLVLD
jgi:hypothetical protein